MDAGKSRIRPKFKENKSKVTEAVNESCEPRTVVTTIIHKEMLKRLLNK